jgi:death on curing protein
MRPKTSAYYEQADLIHQAVLLTIGISQAQAFLDGNKRTAFIALDVFLRGNNILYLGQPKELAQWIETVAIRSSELEVATNDFIEWLRQNVTVVE